MLIVLTACAAVLAVGVLVGYASSRGKLKHRQQTQQHEGGANAQRLPDLPLPDSAVAQQMLSDPATPGRASWAGFILLAADMHTPLTASPLYDSTQLSCEVQRQLLWSMTS